MKFHLKDIQIIYFLILFKLKYIRYKIHKYGNF